MEDTNSMENLNPLNFKQFVGDFGSPEFQAEQQTDVNNHQHSIWENDVEAGGAAIDAVANMPMLNRELSNDKTNLIVNYLPGDMVERELHDMFIKFGAINKLKIIRDPHTCFSYGFGFVDYDNPRSAALAQFLLDGREVRGKRLKVSFARPRSLTTKNAKLYVSRLPPEIDEVKLRYLFGFYGNILDVNILRNKFTGRPRGVAFIRFEQHLAAEMAQTALDQYIPPGYQRHIEVRFVIPKIKPPLRPIASSHQGQLLRSTSFARQHNSNYRRYIGLQHGKMIFEYQSQRSMASPNNLRAIPMEPPPNALPMPQLNNNSTYDW